MRTALRCAAMVVMAVAACSPVRPSSPPATIQVTPTPASSPAQASATLRISGVIREHCGSVGGCGYFAEIVGPTGSVERQFGHVITYGMTDPMLVIDSDPANRGDDEGFPPLDVGEYELTVSSWQLADEFAGEVAPRFKLDSTCSLSFEVAPAQAPLHATADFHRGTCSLAFLVLTGVP